ncbi:sulfotransferase [candidate division CSSED10-310 bacterium]|uniref:Sulfotransferase n=1 Tax=candidate division CSSED10-310 bacterium TaxID=2855610 RepID=A0ABV6Z0M5_UNCC1
MAQRTAPETYGFYIGFPKTATTFLQLSLCHHPEIDYLHKSRFFVGDRFKHGFSWYSSIYSDDSRCRVEGDEMLISDLYQSFSETIDRISKLVPEARIIISTRDKADWLHSSYSHLLREGYYPSFKKYLDYEVGKQFLQSLLEIDERIEQCQQLFKTPNVLVIDVEDIRENAPAVIKNLYSFLGVDHDFTPPDLTTEVNVNPPALSLLLIKYFYLACLPYDKLRRLLSQKIPLPWKLKFREMLFAKRKNTKNIDELNFLQQTHLNNPEIIRKIEFRNSSLRANIYLYKPFLLPLEPLLRTLSQKLGVSVFSKKDQLAIEKFLTELEQSKQADQLKNLT